MLCLFTECYVKKANLQCGDAVIHKTASVEDNHLQTDVFSASTGMDATDHHAVLWEPLVGIVRILVQYDMGFSTALVPQP